MQRIYLDANATAPLDTRVREAMIPWLDAGNPSSPHAEGRAARAAIDEAREQVAALIGAHHREIIFTSGATEADTLALLGSLDGIGGIACSSVEHPAVLRTLEGLAVELVQAPVDSLGRLEDSFRIPDGVGLATFMLANNETGTILPVRELAKQAHAVGAVMHTDAVQACGKMPVNVDELGVDMLSLSAHKMGGPKGAGALYVRRGTRLRPIAHGGEHERGLRPGTENVAAIVGLGTAAQLAIEEVAARVEHWRALSAHLFDRLESEFPDVRINSPREGRVQNTVSITFPDVEGEAVLLGLDLEGVAVATGSACSSGAAEPSHVLRAMGLSHAQAERSIRISMHAATTRAEIDICLNTLARVVKNLRSLAV
ncbi:MAG: cysteine desulfurase family protein [Planctomycetota bacterium]